jgi:hypothetical protein
MQGSDGKSRKRGSIISKREIPLGSGEKRAKSGNKSNDENRILKKNVLYAPAGGDKGVATALANKYLRNLNKDTHKMEFISDQNLWDQGGKETLKKYGMLDIMKKGKEDTFDASGADQLRIHIFGHGAPNDHELQGKEEFNVSSSDIAHNMMVQGLADNKTENTKIRIQSCNSATEGPVKTGEDGYTYPTTKSWRALDKSVADNNPTKQHFSFARQLSVDVKEFEVRGSTGFGASKQPNGTSSIRPATGYKPNLLNPQANVNPERREVKHQTEEAPSSHQHHFFQGKHVALSNVGRKK